MGSAVCNRNQGAEGCRGHLEKAFSVWLYQVSRQLCNSRPEDQMSSLAASWDGSADLIGADTPRAQESSYRVDGDWGASGQISRLLASPQAFGAVHSSSWHWAACEGLSYDCWSAQSPFLPLPLPLITLLFYAPLLPPHPSLSPQRLLVSPSSLISSYTPSLFIQLMHMP